MSGNKTQPRTTSVETFIDSLADTKRQDDARALINMMRGVSSEEPVMWGPSIIGFGTYHYKYASGREGDWMKIGFSPRVGQFSLYFSCDLSVFADDLADLGKYTTGKGCLYVKKLADIDSAVLRKIVAKAYEVAGDYDAERDKS